MRETPRARLVAYGVAMLATAVSLLVRWVLWQEGLGDAVPHMTFFPAVMIAAYFGGFWPGLLATFLGAVAANSFFIHPFSASQVRSVNDIAALTLFVLVGTIISGLSESLHRARRRLVAQERQRAEEALRQTEERFRQLAENIHEIFWMRDARDNRLIYISPGYEEVSGRTCQSLYDQPRSWVESIHPDDRDRLTEYMEQHRHGVFTEGEFRVVRPDGSVRWMRSRAFPIKDPCGHLSRIAGLAEDITERKHAEEALSQERYLLHTLLENVPDNIYFKDAVGRFVRINKALTTYFGLTDPAQALGKTDFDFFTEEHARAACADEQEIMRTGQPVVGKEERETWLDNRVRWVSTTKMPFRDKDGTIIGTFGVSRDITKLKLVEEALRESEQRFRTFVDHATDAFFLQDDSGVILDVNRQACESLGYTRDELVGKTPGDFDPDITPALLEELDRRLNAREMVAFESHHRRKDGAIFPVDVRGRAFWEGGRRFLVSLARDISQRKQDEALLEGQKRILELIIQGEPLLDVLTVLCRTIEELAHGEMLASVLLLDADGVHLRHGAAPSLPESYNRAIDGLAIGPSVGSCGTAAYRREPVCVWDIASDPLWAPYAELALSHGLRGCWSSPILSSTAEVLGTFAMYYRQPRHPTPRDLRAVDIVTRTVAIAIEQSRAEQALRESEERFRGTFENAAVGMAHTDLHGRFLRVNQRFCRIVGYPREGLLQKTFQDITHPDDLAASIEPFTALMRGESPAFGLEKRYLRQDRSPVWVELFVSLQQDAAGNPAYAIAVVQDISERKRLEEALREGEHRWRSLTEALPQLVWSAAPDGACDYFSRQWTQHTGVPESDLLGWRWLAVLHPDDREPTRKLWTDSVAGRGPYDVEYRVRRSDGVYRWFKTRGVPIRGSEKTIFRWFGTCTDITDAKQAETELRLAKDAAEAANRAKDEFLANVSHEIRTPMNAVLGMTDLALDTALNENQRQYLRTVKSAADSLLGLLNDLLDFSKIEAGKLELDPADFSLRAAVGDILRALATRAHEKGLELAYHVQPEVPDALVGDAGRLRQVLLNLVGNAIKFTSAGEVVVRVETADEPAADIVALRFAVSDTGIGIPPDKQERIFRAFEQEDTSTTRKYGGTGLGLTIAARLVALMGGTITVDSTPGRGSTFAFTARFGPQLHPGESVAAPPPVLLRDLGVLVVDDNATNRHILQEWLRGWRMEPQAVGDGLTALSALRRAVSQGQAVRAGAAGRPHARHRRPGPGRHHPRVRPAICHAHHPAHLGGPPRRPGQVARAADSPPAQAGRAGGTPRDDLPGAEPDRRRCARAGPGARAGVGPDRRAAAHPGGRGQRVQRPAPGAATRPARPPCAAGEQRPGGAGAGGRRRLRPAAPGRSHAGAGRLPGHPGDSGARTGRGGTPAGHRLDGALAARGPRALPRGGHG
jgi:PAS domain S-box-containing protein